MSVGSSTAAAAAAPLAGFPRQAVLAGAAFLARTQHQQQMQKQTQVQMSISPEGQLPRTTRAGLQLPLGPSPPLVPASPHAGPPTHPARFLARSNVCQLHSAALRWALGAKPRSSHNA
ncbi:hypothetical protein GGI11_007199 [Coemansia sp. RSA 2049]|nr:hypothetical protein GGI11_007199 [Coemansia sp. RSA 2049]